MLLQIVLLGTLYLRAGHLGHLVPHYDTCICYQALEMQLSYLIQIKAKHTKLLFSKFRVGGASIPHNHGLY